MKPAAGVPPPFVNFKAARCTRSAHVFRISRNPKYQAALLLCHSPTCASLSRRRCVPC